MPQAARVAVACLLAALAAPLGYFLFVGSWREAIASDVFVSATIYSVCTGVPLGFLLPMIARRIGRRGRRLIVGTSAAALILTGAGCLVAVAILSALGVIPPDRFWKQYSFTARIAATMSVVVVGTLFAYESLAAQLQKTRAQLRERELLAAEARLQALESRIHPHFLFNTLNSISSLIPVDAARAEETVGRLASLLRGSLDMSRRPLVPLSAELDLVRNYLEIEKTRLAERLRYRFAVPDAALAWTVPPLALQSLVENSVKHAIAGAIDGGEIEIAAACEAGALRLEVRDSGAGFDLSCVAAGHGIENLVARLDALFGSAAHLEVGRRDGRSVVTLIVPEAHETAGLHR